MSNTRPLWADGEPEELAFEFFGLTVSHGKGLGRRHYTCLVEAIASASVHNAWAQTPGPHDQIVANVTNIFRTAQEVHHLVVATVPPDCDDSDLQEFADEESSSSSSSSTINMDEPLSEGRDSMHADNDEIPLHNLERAVHNLLATDPAASTSVPTSAHPCHPPDRRMRAEPATQIRLSPASSRSSPPDPDPNLLHLSDIILSDILALLDSRSAAAAALACKRLHVAYARARLFDLSPPFRAYLAALLALRSNDEFSDGSPESAFAANFPLDGSPVCGADLEDDNFTRRMTAAMPDMEQLFAVLSAPGERTLEDFRAELACTESRRLPAPHPRSSPLAFFRRSEKVPFSVSGAGETTGRPKPRRRYQLRHSPPQEQQQQQHQSPPPASSLEQLQNLEPAAPPWPELQALSGTVPCTPPATRPAIACTTPVRQLPPAPNAAVPTIDFLPDMAMAGAGEAASACHADGLVAAAAATGPVPSSAAMTPIAAAVAAGRSGSGSSVCCFSNAMCDVQELLDMPMGRMHCDGDLLALVSSSFGAGGNGGGDGGDGGGSSIGGRGGVRMSSRRGSSTPMLIALTLSRGFYPKYDRMSRYDIRDGSGRWPPSSPTSSAAVAHVCADSANGMIWVAHGGSGGHILGFRSPGWSPSTSPGPSGSRRGVEDCSGGSTALQYVMHAEVRGLGGSLAGLHALGTRLICVKSSGAVLCWDTGDMEPCGLSTGLAAAAIGGAGSQGCGVGGGLDGDDAMLDCPTEGTDADMHDMLFEYDDDLTEVRPQQRRRRDLTANIATGSGSVAAIEGVRPHSVSVLSLPSPLGRPSPAKLLRGLTRLRTFESSELYGDSGIAVGGPIRLTRLLNTDAAPTLAAALGGSIIVTYDMETLQVKQRLFGHLYDITDIAAPPSAWQQPSLFATCAHSGDVKIWDMRTSGSSAAVTLTGGETWQLNAVVLASAGGGAGGGGGGSSGGSLGAGMVCFAGGQGESIWSWDLRGGHARVMYELSTGNTQVLSLAWHAAGSSLWASCKSPWQSARATCDPQDWRLLQDDGNGAAAGAAAGGGRSDNNIFSAGGATDAAGGGGGVGGLPAGGAHCSVGGSKCSAAGSSGLGGGGSSSGPASGLSGTCFLPPHPDTVMSLSRDGDNPMTRPGDGGVGRHRYWPTRPKHQPADFDAYFNMARSCVLRYRFSEHASRSIPQSWEPQF
ncbi:hypothetical protein Vretimale_10178 [Volvox reticuliferus]|uniref:F-box domain-containing protein n=1 Tax=Volvox reticuliferus TaxID=1737510 RepID=A0A8J4GF01_9CHLO|nr:hypothetical protein Vretifemale_706 [Volvox reticuliferus]GIM05782.1 hypothetical protein Vretimale_10178 [Volvox reticuliferus]